MKWTMERTTLISGIRQNLSPTEAPKHQQDRDRRAAGIRCPDCRSGDADRQTVDRRSVDQSPGPCSMKRVESLNIPIAVLPRIPSDNRLIPSG